jgi:hypothetical protein
MKNFDANACMDAFCALCEEFAINDLMSLDECQYWVFELGYRSNNASLAEFGELCDLADRSELISTIDCQYWLFERGHLAARRALLDLSESSLEDLTVSGKSATFGILPTFVN